MTAALSVLLIVQVGWQVAASIAAAFILESNVGAALGLSVMLRERMCLLYHYLRKLDGCKFAHFVPSQVFSEDSLAIAERERPERQYGALGHITLSKSRSSNGVRLLDQNVNIWEVDVPDASTIAPAGYAAYHATFGPCHIFVRSLSDQSNLVQRFFLHHELGHTLMGSNITNQVLSRGVALHVLVICILCPFIDYSFATVFIFGAYIATVYDLRLSIKAELRERKLRQEIRSDQFAAKCFNEAERKYLRDLLARFALRDPYMNDYWNSHRNAWLQHFLLDPFSDQLPLDDLAATRFRQQATAATFLLTLVAISGASLPSFFWILVVSMGGAAFLAKIFIAGMYAENEMCIMERLGATDTSRLTEKPPVKPATT